jgi:hypothetical protein
VTPVSSASAFVASTFATDREPVIAFWTWCAGSRSKYTGAAWLLSSPFVTSRIVLPPMATKRSMSALRSSHTVM